MLKLLLISIFKNSELFLFVIKLEIIEQLRSRPKTGENHQHLLAYFWKDFLAVAALAGWSVLIEGVFDVDELSIWYILNLYPLNTQRPWPLAFLLPQVLVLFSVIYPARHLCYPTKVLGLVDTEEEIDISFYVLIFLIKFSNLLISLIKNLVPSFRRAPNFIFDGLVHVFFGVGFNYEEFRVTHNLWSLN